MNDIPKNFLIVDNSLEETISRCRAMITYSIEATFDNCPSRDGAFGRYLLLESVNEALAYVEADLHGGEQS